MRMLHAAIIAVLLSTGTTVAQAATVPVNNVVTTENILDKLMALVKEYTDKVVAVESMEELNATFLAFKQEIAEFTKKNAAEIAAFDKELSNELLEKYKSSLETAIKHFEKALEKKAMLFLE